MCECATTTTPAVLRLKGRTGRVRHFLDLLIADATFAHASASVDRTHARAPKQVWFSRTRHVQPPSILIRPRAHIEGATVAPASGVCCSPERREFNRVSTAVDRKRVARHNGNAQSSRLPSVTATPVSVKGAARALIPRRLGLCLGPRSLGCGLFRRIRGMPSHQARIFRCLARPSLPSRRPASRRVPTQSLAGALSVPFSLRRDTAPPSGSWGRGGSGGR